MSKMFLRVVGGFLSAWSVWQWLGSLSKRGKFILKASFYLISFLLFFLLSFSLMALLQGYIVKIFSNNGFAVPKHFFLVSDTLNVLVSGIVAFSFTSAIGSLIRHLYNMPSCLGKDMSTAVKSLLKEEDKTKQRLEEEKDARGDYRRIYKLLGLSSIDERLIFKIQYYLQKSDIDLLNTDSEENYLEKKRKLIEFAKFHGETDNLPITKASLLEEIKNQEERYRNNPLLPYVIALHVVLFDPFGINVNDMKTKLPFHLGLRLSSRDLYIKNRDEILFYLVSEGNICQRFLDLRDKIKKDISSREISYLTPVLGAAALGTAAFTAAPVIGGAIGSLVTGLHGAAATSAGLALMGGGSLATGGFGMVGGTAAIGTLGLFSGLGIGATVNDKGALIFSFNPEIALNECIKIEILVNDVILRVFSNVGLKDEIVKIIANETIPEVENIFFSMKEEKLPTEEEFKKEDQEKNLLKTIFNRKKEEILSKQKDSRNQKDLKKIIGYMRNLCRRIS